MSATFGVLVIGPPGSGKTTLCAGLQQFFDGIARDHVIVNLDFANDRKLPYATGEGGSAVIDARGLCCVEEVMEKEHLGPNGAMIFCFSHLETNLVWLETRLEKHRGKFIIVDCPGQVETYTHDGHFKSTVDRLARKLDIRFVVAHLVDSTLCSDLYKYLGALLVSASGQMLLEFPHVNVFSKSDLLIRNKSELAMRMEFFAEEMKLSQILEAMFPTDTNNPLDKKFRRYTEELVEVLEDTNIVPFVLLNVESKTDMTRLIRLLDKATGFSLDGSLIPGGHDELSSFDLVFGGGVGSLDGEGILGDEMFGEINQRLFDETDDDS